MNKKKAIKKQQPTREHTEREPEYMVQVLDPRNLRKDLLESLREIILFMQGYEKFRKIQEEKVATFAVLKNDVKELNNLINNKLRAYLPKGKLRNLKVPTATETQAQMFEENEPEPLPPKPQPALAPPKKEIQKETPKESPSKNELDELESQLRDIESQLRKVQ